MHDDHEKWEYASFDILKSFRNDHAYLLFTWTLLSVMEIKNI